MRIIDVCQIYSVVYDGIRYTVEFRKRKGKFVLRQVQGPHNGVSTEAVTLYIQGFIYKVCFVQDEVEVILCYFLKKIVI